MSLQPGTHLGPYEIIAAIGAGGMGEVYRARDPKLNRDVALKVLPNSVTADPDRVARFRREAQVLAALNHPHMGHIYGFEDSGARHALVLELVDGPTLADRIARGPLALDEALPIANAIADALEAAHEHGIIHRDLKPANVKVRDDGTVKVLFRPGQGDQRRRGGHGRGRDGVADVHGPRDAAGVIIGTAAYMPPEQARGKAGEQSRRSRQYHCADSTVRSCESSAGQRVGQGSSHMASSRLESRRPMPVLGDRSKHTVTGENARPDYGIDAPGVVRNLVVVGLVMFALSISSFVGFLPKELATQPFGRVTVRFPLATNGLFVALGFFGAGAWMYFGSRFGKIAERDRLLNKITWRGHERVLDVGCGRGLLLVGVAKRLKEGTATGIDIWQSEDLSGNRADVPLRNAELEGVKGRVTVQTADMRRLPFSGQLVRYDCFPGRRAQPLLCC